MKRFLIFAISIMAFIPSFSQDSKVKRPDSYNYQRGVEAIQQENSEEALEYLNKEIKDNPKNGYAFSWIAMVRCHQRKMMHTRSVLKFIMNRKSLTWLMPTTVN